MVLSDPLQPAVNLPENSLRSPYLLDRLAAFAIDVFCFFFVFGVLLAPLKRQLMISRLLENHSQSLVGYSLGALSVFVITVLIQSGFLFFRGATPGKLILRMRVVDVWTQRPLTLSACLIRSLAWTLGSLLFFLPQLGILYNIRRRAFYDRLADSEVVSLSGRYAPPPTTHALQAARIMLLSCCATALIFFGQDIWRMIRVNNDVDNWREELSRLVPETCSSVLEASEDWGRGHSDLEIALTLFSANVVDPECLSIEAFKSFQSGDQLEMAYLAKSFLHSEEAEISDEYLSRVCVENKSSLACKFSKMIGEWASDNLENAQTQLDDLLLSGKAYVRVWGIKHFERTKDFKSELKALDLISDLKGLGQFVSIHRAMSYWGLHQKDLSRLALTSVMPELDDTQKLDLNSWFCFKELGDSCSGLETKSCQKFSQDLVDGEKLAVSGHLLTLLRVRECQAGDTLEFDELYLKAPNENTLVFIKAVQDLKKGKVDLAKQVLLSVWEDTEWEKSFKDESLRRVIPVLTLTELNHLSDQWQVANSQTWEWRTQGLTILRAYVQRNMVDAAVSVAARLSVENALPELDRKSLVVMAFRAGDRKVAREFANQPSRGPAAEGQDVDNDYISIYLRLKDGQSP